MNKIKRKWKDLHWGNKINVVFSFLSLLAILCTLMTNVIGRYWNPFELGRDFERHCLYQQIRDSRQDTLNSLFVKHKDLIHLVPYVDAEECNEYIIEKK